MSDGDVGVRAPGRTQVAAGRATTGDGAVGMIDLIRAAAARDGDRAAVITGSRTVTYGQLLADAERVAGTLAARNIARFGIVAQDAATVIALLAGASSSGAEACVYAPADSAEATLAVAAQFDHEVLVTDQAALDGPVQTVGMAEMLAGDGAPAGAPPARRPLLILTTGTTGIPKGVRHDWTRVLRAARGVQPAPQQRWLLAYSLHQFGGLQILVHVMAAGATLVAPQPPRPTEGLAAMRAHGVDHASATPTFWRFLLAELRSDGAEPPPLRQITIGGEAVPDQVLAQLRATFPDARVSQIYGANESGNLRSVRDGLKGLPVTVLEAGEDADVQLKIVDGELWVRSRIGMLGYYGEPEIDPDAWRPTGDLVDVEGDRIVFRGRASQVINVGGVKVHPMPIEERIGAVPGVAMARVYGRPNAMTGSIVAVEVVAAPGADTDTVDGLIREACDDLPAAARPRSIRFVDAVATAPGHKISRVPADAS